MISRPNSKQGRGEEVRTLDSLAFTSLLPAIAKPHPDAELRERGGEGTGVKEPLRSGEISLFSPSPSTAPLPRSRRKEPPFEIASVKILLEGEERRRKEEGRLMEKKKLERRAHARTERKRRREPRGSDRPREREEHARNGIGEDAAAGDDKVGRQAEGKIK
ncbi:hypothetical protein BHE74_00012930 [Ensete ventricosum]|nr:hypothetical protein BHE74_00012930 [Ensete ventricosum]